MHPQAVDPDASTRDRLLQAAAISFGDVGAPRSRVEEIAAMAGVTTGALYKLFAGKNDLLAEALGHRGENYLLDIHAAIESSPGDTILERATEALVYRFTRSDESFGDIVALGALTTALHEPDAAERVLPAVHRIREQTVETIVDTSERAPVSPDIGVGTAADFIVALLLGTIVARALDLPKPDPDELRNLTRRVLNLIVDET